MWERQGDTSVNSRGLLHSSSSIIDVLWVVCKDGTAEGDACLWARDWGSTVESPFFSPDSFNHCPGQPHPAWFIPQSCDQTSCCYSLRKGVDLIHNLEVGSGSGLGRYSSSTSSLSRNKKAKSKHRKINFLSCFLPLCSFFNFSMWELSCLLSCPLIDATEQIEAGLCPVPLP